MSHGYVELAQYAGTTICHVFSTLAGLWDAQVRLARAPRTAARTRLPRGRLLHRTLGVGRAALGAGLIFLCSSRLLKGCAERRATLAHKPRVVLNGSRRERERDCSTAEKSCVGHSYPHLDASAHMLHVTFVFTPRVREH